VPLPRSSALDVQCVARRCLVAGRVDGGQGDLGRFRLAAVRDRPVAPDDAVLEKTPFGYTS
jgi:hypothetical protein